MAEWRQIHKNIITEFVAAVAKLTNIFFVTPVIKLNVKKKMEGGAMRKWKMKEYIELFPFLIYF
jgi:hypothetical protein